MTQLNACQMFSGVNSTLAAAHTVRCVGARVTDTVVCCSVIGNMLEYLDIFFGLAAACRFMIACDRHLKLRCTEDELEPIEKVQHNRAIHLRLTCRLSSFAIDIS